MLPVHKQISSTLLKINSSIELRKIRDIGARPQLHLPVQRLQHLLDTSLDRDLIQKTFPDCVQYSKEIIFPINRNQFVHNALTEPNILDKRTVSGDNHPDDKQRIVVEFSSPNIAKPFHVGHLRSTIIGNFLANLFRSLHHDVVRLNYLGDWGTQFGLLTIGMDTTTIDEADLRAQPIRHLYEAYVRANQMAQHDETVVARAREIFLSMENGLNENVERWQSYRRHTVDELRLIYRRLGVTFDEYHWESDYRRNLIQPQLDRFIADGVLQRDDSGKLVTTVMVGGQERCVPIVKSDGSTLYLARDLAALIDRSVRYRFDRMFYVVDHGQSDHFQTLFEMGRKVNVAHIDGAEHVKFGRIQGMSTRKGNVVFLKNILDEAKEIMQQKQRQTSSNSFFFLK